MSDHEGFTKRQEVGKTAVARRNSREFKQLLRLRLRLRQRVRYKPIGFNERTNGLQVRYNFWYISLPHSAKQQHEMNKFKFFGVRGHTTLNFHCSVST